MDVPVSELPDEESRLNCYMATETKKSVSATPTNLAVRVIVTSISKVFLQMWNGDLKKLRPIMYVNKWRNIWRKGLVRQCDGYRLKEETLAVKVNGSHIGKVTELSIAEADRFFKNLELSEKDTQIAKPDFTGN